MSLSGASTRFLPSLIVAASALVVLVLVVTAFAVGRYPVSMPDLLRVLWAWASGGVSGLDATVEAVVLQIRGPRVLAALLVGAALAAAGAAYQSLFRNPLVSPDILGVSAGAAVGAVLGIFLSLGVVMIQSMAFAGGLLAVGMVYFVAKSVRGHDPLLVLVLAGVVLGALLGACVALMKYLADPYNQLPAITFWLLGSLASTDARDMWAAAPLLLIGLLPLWLLRWRINVLSLDDEEARALGVPTARIRIAVIVGATLMTSAAVAISGVIGWIGLVIPHFARLLTGPDFTRLLPVSVLLGAGFLVAVDTLARTIASIEVPLGVLTAFVGTPLFLWQLATARRSWQ
ncbi:MAG: FecCD family ABC transporter permease [Burkholderiales bacterium]